MEAVELYRKANRHPDAAKLLSEIAQVQGGRGRGRGRGGYVARKGRERCAEEW